jgi:hypothetical protein
MCNHSVTPSLQIWPKSQTITDGVQLDMDAIIERSMSLYFLLARMLMMQYYYSG